MTQKVSRNITKIIPYADKIVFTKNERYLTPQLNCKVLTE